MEINDDRIRLFDLDSDAIQYANQGLGHGG